MKGIRVPHSAEARGAEPVTHSVGVPTLTGLPGSFIHLLFLHSLLSAAQAAMHDAQAKMVAAATGSLATALTMTPFDVVKTRLQTQRPAPLSSASSRPPPGQVCCQPLSSVGCVRNMSSLSTSARAAALPSEVVCIWDHGAMRTERVTGFWDAVRHVWKAEGVRGLWKGAGTTLIIAVPASSSYMLTYDYFLRVLVPSFSPSPAVTPLIAGALSRSLITSIVSPLELVRTNLQSTPLSPDQPHTLRSVLTSIRALVKSQGVGSLWRGVGPTLWRDVPFSGIYWACYESCKHRMERRSLSGPWVAFVSGAVSGSTAALITQPFDVLKTRRQTLLMSTTTDHTQTSRTIGLISHMIRTEGVSALFTGITPRIVKIAPACGIMIACFEGVGKLLMNPKPE